MLLEEAQARLKKSTINAAQLDVISPIYCLLGFDKDDFCKLVDTIGIEKWVAAETRWQRLDQAKRDMDAKESYIDAQCHLEELEAELVSYARIYRDIQDEIAEAKKVVDKYKPIPTD